MATRQFIGARYIPKIVGDWDNTKEYEPFMVVYYNGASYTSKTYIPTGIDISNTNYWALSADYNAQVAYYRAEVEDLKSKVCYFAKTVPSMKEIDWPEECVIFTAGYYSPGDGGDASYTVVSEEPSSYYEVLDNGLYAKLNIHSDMNVNQFGAKTNDDTFDSTAAFEASLTTLKYAKMLSGRYYISTLQLEHDYTLYCDTPNTAGIKVTGDGVKVHGNNIKLANFEIIGGTRNNRQGNGIENTTECNNLIVDNVIFYYFDKCINLSHYIYGLSVSNSLFITNNQMINLPSFGSGYNCYNIRFENCNELNCDIIGTIANARVEFDNCIITINAAEALTTSETSSITFIKCAFEQENEITTGNFIFYAYGYLVFNECSFTENCSANTCYWFTLPATCKGIELKYCTIGAYSDDLKCAGLVNPTYSTAAKTGIFRLKGLNYYGQSFFEVFSLSSIRRVINDEDRFGIIIFTSTDTSLLIAGQKYSVFNSDSFLYEAIFDGTNLNPIYKFKQVSTAINTSGTSTDTALVDFALPSGATVKSFSIAFVDGTPEVENIYIDASHTIHVKTSTSGLLVVYTVIYYC